VFVGAGALLGESEDNTPNQAVPEQVNTGLTLVGRRARIPEGVKIGRNVVVRPRVTEAAFKADKVVASGRTVGK
jgi:glucose-1-phosphate adenylyltransferase